MSLPSRLAFIPSPTVSGFHVGPVEVHFYALGYLAGIALAVLIAGRRWRASGGDPELVSEVALWVVPAGIIGGRIYFDVTTPMDIPHVWYGVFAVWTGGLGIWGGVAAGALVGAWRVRRHGIAVGPFANAVAPALLVAQGSAGSATTSTRSCSASPPRCRGGWRSRTSTGQRAGCRLRTCITARSSRPSFTS